MNLRPGVAVILAVFILLPGLVFIGLRFMLPGDGSNPVVDLQETGKGGLVVHPLSPSAQGLQDGDIVTAIQGQPVDQYVNEVFRLRRSVGSAGTIGYTVLRGGRTLQLSVDAAGYPFAQVVKEHWSIYLFVVYLELVGLVMFILRPRVAAVQLFFMISNLIFTSTPIYFPGLKVDDLLYPGLVLLYFWGVLVLFTIFLGALVHWSLIFPKRHPILARRPGLPLWIYLGAWLPFSLYLVVRWGAITSPAERMMSLVQGTLFSLFFYFALTLVCTYSSYRVSDSHGKRQCRWLMWSLVISVVPYLAFSVVPSLMGYNFRLANSLVGLLWCKVPTSFAIAILRERLFDIDVIIRRTLIYTTLTVILGALYFASILLLQGIFQTFTGKYQSELATVLSTLIIAVLFTPLRGRIQNGIDRRFYRRKYDAEKMLNAFALTVREEVEFERLSNRLLDLLDETMEPEGLSLWIGKPGRPTGVRGKKKASS